MVYFHGAIASQKRETIVINPSVVRDSVFIDDHFAIAVYLKEPSDLYQSDFNADFPLQSLLVGNSKQFDLFDSDYKPRDKVNTGDFIAGLEMETVYNAVFQIDRKFSATDLIAPLIQSLIQAKSIDNQIEQGDVIPRNYHTKLLLSDSLQDGFSMAQIAFKFNYQLHQSDRVEDGSFAANWTNIVNPVELHQSSLIEDKALFANLISKSYFGLKESAFVDDGFKPGTKLVLPDLIPVGADYCPQAPISLNQIPDPLVATTIDYCPQDSTNLNQAPDSLVATAIDYCPQDSTQLTS